MQFIQPKVEIIPQSEGLIGVYKQIEIAGRTCYKSEDKITNDSCKEFVQRMMNSGHTAMLEHGTVYLAMPITTHYSADVNVYMDYPTFCKVNRSSDFKFKDKFGDPVDCWCITTNLRFILEHDLWLDVEELLCEPTKLHEKRITARFTCDRGVSHELVRHKKLCAA